CVREGFGPLAAYQARKSLARERTARAAAIALRLAAAAWRASAPAERVLTARMFLAGPVRALGLQPA
ncbi:MAG TPA: hypothetical protein VHE13_08245, partial [Opitutus sp.]|nr:hypothetical protein [Opitutus sp.]